jgi:hypothetical protein
MGVVPCLDEGRDQLNERFPKRSKTSDGAWGNKAHAQTTSSHNGDKSGKPEWRDGDSVDEVRARDFDADLNDPNCTMEQVVQEWVRLCRSGAMWWVRYIIFNGRIWHKKDGFKTRTYTGKNKHDKHAHVNSDFSQKADTAKGTNWGLKGFRITKPKPPKPATPAKPALLTVDGDLGPKTVSLWQKIMGTTVDGKIDDKDSELVRRLQTRLNAVLGLKGANKLKVDGDLGTMTIRRLQSYIKAPVTGSMGKETVKQLQRRLNTGKF